MGYADEGQGLFRGDTGFRDNGPTDPYIDEFHDEDGAAPALSDIARSRKKPPAALRRSRWRRWAIILLCLIVLIGVAIAVLAGSLIGKGGDDENDDQSKGAIVSPPPTMPPTPSPQQPTVPSPADPTFAPTTTAMPTLPVFWTQTAEDSSSETDTELLGSALDISADGKVVWYGSWNYTAAAGGPPMVGRIRRLNVETGDVVEVFGSNPEDSLGYQVSGSADGEFVAGFASSNGTLTVWDYMASRNELRVYAETNLPYAWDYMTVIFDLSKDGQWLAVTGTEFKQGEPGSQAIEWKLRIYQVVTGSGGSLVQFGPDITIEEDMPVQPELYAMDMTHDGSVVAVSIAGVEGATGRVRVYQRQQGEYYTVMGSANGDALLTSNAARAEDFYARRLQVRNVAGETWLAIGWEAQNAILMRRWNEETGAWQEAGNVVASEDEYGEKAEFGYDFDISSDGTRMIVGVRCFNYCRGADQVFQLVDGEWAGLGNIVVGYEDTFFGEAVSISGDGTTIAVGAPEDCNPAGVCGGAVYVYSYVGPDLPATALPDVPAVAPSPPTPSPTAESMWPTTTSMPTYAFGWSQTNGVFDSVDQELFGAAGTLDGSGTILFAGAFENGEYAPESGRIVRVDMAAGNAELMVYGDAYDFLGFDVSCSSDGNRVAGYLSSTSTIEIADYSEETRLLQQTSQLPTEFNSTSATFSLSADGKWVVGVGVIDSDDDRDGTLTIKTFMANSAGTFDPWGQDVALEKLTEAPTLDIHLLQDGSFMAISVAGWNGYVGQVRTYKRNASGWEQIGSDLTSDLVDDFYGKTVRLAQNEEMLTLLFIGAPYRNQVLVYQMMESGLEWEPYGSVIAASEDDFTDQDEFGFDIDASYDGKRVVVGIRCFDSCRGAAQVFEHDGSDWQPLGQIIAGFSDSYFGEAVDCNADCSVIAVGAPEDCGDAGCGGSVYVFAGQDNRSPQ